jgi:translation elongation factor EF-Tu-like GTPase
VLLRYLIIIAIFATPLAQADIVFLGDKARLQLLKKCGASCSAGGYKIISPKLNAKASEVASLAQDASHAVIVVDATQGPLPVTREHVLIARQAGIPSLSIMFANVSSLEGMADAGELLELEELEVREVFNMYEMGGDNAPVYHDSGIKVAPNMHTNAIGLNSVLSKLQATPERKVFNVKYFTGKSLSTYVYLLTPQEAKHTESLSQGGSVKLWVNGQVSKGKVASKGLAPGSNGELQIILEVPVKAAEGSRYLLENNGQIIAVGVIVRVSS